MVYINTSFFSSSYNTSKLSTLKALTLTEEYYQTLNSTSITLNFQWLAPFFATIQLFIAVIILIGNTTVIYAVIKFQNLRTASNLFVIILSIADLMVGLFIPYYVVFYFVNDLGKISCLIRYACIVFSNGISCYIMLIAAIDRYLAILHPFTHQKKVTTTSISLITSGIIIYIAIESLLPLFGINTWKEGIICDLMNIVPPWYGITVVSVQTIIGITLTIFLYTKIFCTVCRQKQKISTNSSLGSTSKVDHKIVVLMTLILGTYILTLTPLVLLVIISYLPNVNQLLIMKVKMGIMCFYFSKSALNPIIYAWKNKDFRTAFLKIMSNKKPMMIM